jgi:hypothetical protein
MPAATQQGTRDALYSSLHSKLQMFLVGTLRISKAGKLDPDKPSKPHLL